MAPEQKADMNGKTNGAIPPAGEIGRDGKWLFLACFTALVATSFGFIIRTQVINDWAGQFGLTETQKGEIFGVGLWPFAISIVLFSLIVDKIGYGKAMVFAFVCHVTSAIVTILADGYWMLYIGTFIVALGNGTVEAVINPIIATMFSREKTKWLNILHAGWPGGLVLGGLLALAMGPGVDWKWKVGLILIPTLLYGMLLLGRHFPLQERVAAGIPYKTMLQEAGTLGALIVVALMVREVGRVFAWPAALQLGVGTVLVFGWAAYVRAVGRPMFIFLLFIMIPLATTELGTDSWITPLLEPVMASLGLQAGWVLVYTSVIMMILRFFAGPIIHQLSPLGLLAASSLIAAVGLIALSKSAGAMIFLAATLYGLGKTFFWPTMLGVAAERFPKGGALTMNTLSAVGMLGVGVVGSVFLGNIQDKAIERELRLQQPALHQQLVGEERTSVFGTYRPVDPTRMKALNSQETRLIEEIADAAKKNALSTVTVFPVVMLICYLVLMAYFKSKGGYEAEALVAERSRDS